MTDVIRHFMTKSQLDNLRVDKPCPVLLTRMTKDGQNYFCKSCSKTVVDFRDKTKDEIKRSINKDTCGIFTNDQLQGQQKTSILRQTLFYFLTVLSFFGFSVRPVSAQTTKTKKDTVSLDFNTQPQDTVRTSKTIMKESIPETNRKVLYRKKKKKYRTVGTPSF